jgi:hypothetical protein
MYAQYVRVQLNVLGTALALGDDFVFAFEHVGCDAECFSRLDLAGPALPSEIKIPVLCIIFGMGQTFLLGALAPVLAGDVCGALPESAIGSFVNVELSSE